MEKPVAFKMSGILEGFAKPHQQSSRTLIRDLQTAVQLLNDDQNLVFMLTVGFAKPSFNLFNSI